MSAPHELTEERLEETIERDFVEGFLGGRTVYERYRREVDENGLVDHLKSAYDEFWGIVDGSSGYNTGRVGYEEGIRLYAIVRTLQPELAVETGVCNGFSTAFLLLALDRNGRGKLHSIDLPEIAGADYEPGTFWEGKGGAAIPSGKEPGWMIPADLKGRWELTVGRSDRELLPLLERVGPIGLFMHDSEHSYECMWFEFTTAFPALKPGGVLVADDMNWNDAFANFAAETECRPVIIGKKLAFLRK
jgi:predicted O-methyltransferase YrrM